MLTHAHILGDGREERERESELASDALGTVCGWLADAANELELRLDTGSCDLAEGFASGEIESCYRLNMTITIGAGPSRQQAGDLAHTFDAIAAQLRMRSQRTH